MKIINVHRAKTDLSKLIARAAHGEEIIIGRAGKPVAKLTAFDLQTKPRKPGLWKGKLSRHHEDFFDRMLIAQAQLEGITLLTHDRRLKAYGDFVTLV